MKSVFIIFLLFPLGLVMATEPFLKEYCFECHSGDSIKGGLDLDQLSGDFYDAEVLRRWVYLHDRVAKHEMPPEKKAKPDAAARAGFLKRLSESLTQADLASREVILRRLNRNEYENTVNDLFGIQVDLQRILPSDEREQGFDNNGSDLAISAEQMVTNLEAADRVLDEVFGPPEKLETEHIKLKFADFRDKDRADRLTNEGGILFGARNVPIWDSAVSRTGTYQVRIRARAVQSEEPVVLLVHGGVTGNIEGHIAGFFEVGPGDFTTIEFTDRAPEKSDCFTLSFPDGWPWWNSVGEDYKGPGVQIEGIEVQGPLETWPPPSRNRLLGSIDPARGTLDDISSLITNLLPKAFRRATRDGEAEPYLALAREAFAGGLPFEAALRRALKGVLSAPEFLFLEEGEKPDDYAIASRLSYFLWSSMPDDELFALARQGKMSQPEALREQVERMLKHEKSARFLKNFTGQWLRLRDIDFTVPDTDLYPEYSQVLRHSMISETREFFREILEKDLSVQTFIDSDFVMVNQPLAEFYGIKNVKGLDIRRVQLEDDSVRGGVMTQVSVLKVSADGTRTSPVLRGVWILKHLFGTPSPPPPPTVAAIEPDIRGASTIREQLAKHRDHSSCNRCHAKIDPPGFALESFDVIGAERTWFRTRQGKYVDRTLHPLSTVGVQYKMGMDVDSSGVLPDGRTFSGIREYKHLLLEDETAMARSLTRLLLSYALGRQAGFSDRAEVEKIVARLKEKNYELRSLIHEIVQSEAFRSP